MGSPSAVPVPCICSADTCKAPELSHGCRFMAGVLPIDYLPFRHLQPRMLDFQPNRLTGSARALLGGKLALARAALSSAC